MKISIGVAPGPNATPLALYAEELGYDRVWLYDSSPIWEDIWIHLGLVAQATTTIKLGTAVLVPHQRHVMTTASAIATIDRMAPGRLACAMGTGYTARRILGKPALSWKFMQTYLAQLRALLRGDVVLIDGEACQMIHRPELAQPRPIDVPILLSALGPKGRAITHEMADGWMGMTPPPEPFDWSVQMAYGTVLAPGESASSVRVIESVGAWEVGRYHGSWEMDRERLATLPGGRDWLAQIESERTEDERHLAVHYGHTTHLSQADRKALAALGNDIPWRGWVGDPESVRARAEQARSSGTTEILYTPSGNDLLREARTFYEAVSALQDDCRDGSPNA